MGDTSHQENGTRAFHEQEKMGRMPNLLSHMATPILKPEDVSGKEAAMLVKVFTVLLIARLVLPALLLLSVGEWARRHNASQRLAW